MFCDRVDWMIIFSIEENRIKIYVRVTASWNSVVWIDDN